MGESNVTDNAEPARAPFNRYVATTMFYAITMALRRKRTLMAGLIVLAPVLLPILAAFLAGGPYALDGNEVFVKLMEMLYIKVMALLMALFFGCALIGEEIEHHTIPNVLVRPIPRLAWCLGKYAGYLVIVLSIAIPALVLAFLACLALGNVTIDATMIKLLLHYILVMAAALASYGAVTMFMGAIVKRPIIVGIIFLFGWQNLVLKVPGVLDFFTVEKYINALLPAMAAQRQQVAVQTALMEFQRKVYMVGAVKAGIVLAILTMLFIGLTVVVVRWREYSSARAVGGK